MPNRRGTPRRLLGHAPLADHYAAAVALALLALCPFIVLTTAVSLVERELATDLGAGRFSLELAAGLSNAGYAFGAVLAADLIQRVSGRRLYLCCESLFVAGSLLAALAPSIAVFTAGRVLQGLATGMLLVAALPPLVTRHGAARLPTTGAVVNLGLFGMVTLGPLVGGAAASAHAWRLLFGAVAALGVAGLVLGLAAFEGNEPPDRGMQFDWAAIPLALGATVLPFLGVSWLARGSFASVLFLAPLAVGLAFLVVLVLGQYRKQEPLMPVRPISHTLPVTGTGAAMIAGATFTTLLVLAELYLQRVRHESPLAVGGLVASQLLGLAAAAWLFRRALATKWTPILALSGLVAIVSGGALLLALSTATALWLVPLAALLLGFGAGAGVAPGLFMAGFSVPSSKIGRTFALVELLRSEAAFLLGPVLLALALELGLPGGVHTGLVIALAVAAGGTCALVVLYLLGGARPHAPELEAWLDGDSSAYHSPPLAARVRDHDESAGAHPAPREEVGAARR